MSKSAAPDDPALTTGALARRLGVAPTTLRSWDRRYGIGPAVRDDGRHRRWRPADVAVLEAMCRLTSAGVPPAEAARAAREGAAGPVRVVQGRSGALPLGGDVRQECRGLARAAVRLDAPAVAGQLTAAVERHGLTTAWQEVMAPTLHAVGRKWASSGDRYVEVEHLLSWHVSTTLRCATRPAATGETAPGATAPGATAPGDAVPWDTVPGDNTPSDTADGPGPVVLACVPGEQHTLALEALNAGLSRAGVPTRMFGAAVPAEALTAAVRRLGPAAVVLWAQARSTASLALARHVAGTRWGVSGARRTPAVVLGGPGWAGRPVPGLPRPTGLGDALETLAGVYGAS
ncbi:MULTISPECIES: MerR family transcriptional regulator [Streptomyces]|uniref:MerR family transcriptional regulator n=2 Tax=Streptomyces TaxID=1883 RepID=A0ABV9ISC1_9ACTN